MPTPPRGYTWNESAKRYTDSRGRFVSKQAVRGAIDRELADADRIVRQLGEDLRNGRISLRDWQTGMRREIKRVHLNGAAAAKGGWAQLSPADYGRIGQIVRGQYGYLEKFAREVERGLPLDGRFTQRVQLYSQAGRSTYHVADRREMETAGYTEERSRLNPADHCQQCRDEAAAGWRPIGEMVPIGQRQCRSRCKCTVEYRQAGERVRRRAGPRRVAA